jgi:hypothetical protein
MKVSLAFPLLCVCVLAVVDFTHAAASTVLPERMSGVNPTLRLNNDDIELFAHDDVFALHADGPKYAFHLHMNSNRLTSQ